MFGWLFRLFSGPGRSAQSHRPAPRRKQNDVQGVQRNLANLRAERAAQTRHDAKETKHEITDREVFDYTKEKAMASMSTMTDRWDEHQIDLEEDRIKEFERQQAKDNSRER